MKEALKFNDEIKKNEKEFKTIRTIFSDLSREGVFAR